MKYLERGFELRFDPSRLVAGSCRAIVARMDYLPPDTRTVADPRSGRTSVTCRATPLGRDYHKVVRGRLRALARRINEHCGAARLRAYTDSAPILEKALAEKAGLGWIGKHTLLLESQRPARGSSSAKSTPTCRCRSTTPAVEDHCGRCSACMTVCPTQAIVGPRRARRAPLHLVPHDRAQGRDPARAAAADRATGSSAATTASSSARGTASRSRAAERTSRHATRSTARRCSSCSAGARRSSSHAPKAARCAGSTTRSGSAIWRSRSATRRTTQRIVAALRTRRAPTRRHLVREHIDWAIWREQLGRAADGGQGSLKKCSR